MPRKIKPVKRGFFHESRLGHNWAKVSVEWAEHPDTPENWKANAEAIAEQAFAAADRARDIVQAMSGKSVRIRENQE
jgi:hypothetical protein